jgi:kynureninase
MDRRTAEALDRDEPLARFRDLFRVEESAPIYMDGNSLGRLSDPVRVAIETGAAEWHEALVGGWTRWIDLPARVGDQIGRMIGASSGETIACDSTTVNLYKLVAAALDARPDRSVIVGDANDFPTDRYVLAGVASARGAQLRLIDSDPIDGIQLDELASSVDDRTALVCLSHVNFRSAARLDLDAVTSIVHEAGSLMLWDLSHSAGAVPVDLGSAGADLAVGCTYKYVNAGPGAPAYLFVRRDLQSQLRQPVWGWFGQQDQFAMGPDYEPALGVTRFLTGTPPVLGLLAVKAAVELLLEAGIELLWAKSQALTAMIAQLVNECLVPAGAALASPSDSSRRGAHVSVAHDLAWPWCEALIENGLVLADFRPPGVIRLGPAPLYTRFVDAFDAVERMADVLTSGHLSRLTK